LRLFHQIFAAVMRDSVVAGSVSQQPNVVAYRNGSSFGSDGIFSRHSWIFQLFDKVVLILLNPA
jgi:hypothetical protein